jgi:hypothetical protein
MVVSPVDLSRIIRFPAVGCSMLNIPAHSHYQHQALVRHGRLEEPSPAIPSPRFPGALASTDHDCIVCKAAAIKASCSKTQEYPPEKKGRTAHRGQPRFVSIKVSA